MNYYDYYELLYSLSSMIPIKKYRLLFRDISQKIIKSYYRTEYLININNRKKLDEDDFIILWVGGGLCGQIRKYILGKYIEIKYNKKVKYDLNWYKYNGLDDSKRLNRNFDLLNIFPDLDFKIAADNEINIYKSCFEINSEPLYDWHSFIIDNKKLYLDGTPNDRDCFYEIKSSIFDKLDFDKYLYNKLSEKNKIILEDIRNTNSVSVHIRMGDFKVHNSILDDNYYIKSIDDIICKLNNITPKFFFFSDDVKYVRKNILCKLKKGYEYVIVDENDNDKGYIDFYLMMNAKHQIASNGSFGYFAYCFNKNKDKILITPENMREYYIKNIDNI
ncbi:alpha-1,2-fucosyltransferase [uncultured Brachyspira sp.]|uniref:alpha-1,2-fucosyltransferase n=1 Tax=uncultured Brachyspira sp. TaxID=221953 RepID=UPI002603DE96|nr:alpha-1,2-fucosyltransferase [uncultured Brachyspira sp.]